MRLWWKRFHHQKKNLIKNRQRRWQSNVRAPLPPKSVKNPRRYQLRKKGTVVRAEQIQLKGPEFGPPEEQPLLNDQPSLIALENAHLHAFNQLSLVNMRQVDQEGGAAVQQTYVNEATRQTRSWFSRMPPSDANGRRNQTKNNASARK